MKKTLVSSIFLLLISCSSKQTVDRKPLEGTWKLISGTTIQGGDTTITDYTRDRSMIKIINATHFAFVNHDLSGGSDSSAFFGAGGGKYEVAGGKYTEFLEYCSDRAWEGHKFEFAVNISSDTLLQMGREKIEGTGIDRLNIEKYVRVSQ